MKFIAFVLMLTVSPMAAAQSDSRVPVIESKPVLTPSQKRADELDRLHGKLRGGQPGVEARIWELWSQSDSVTADVLLEQASKAVRDTQYDAAEPMLDQLIHAFPDYSEAYNRRALLHYLKDDLKSALADIDRVLELEPRHFAAMAGRGLILKELGREGEALESLRAALAIVPNREDVKAMVKELEHKSPDI